MNMDNDLKLAVDASIKAGEVIMQYYCADYEIKEKGYHNPVTTADKAADAFLKSTLKSARPGYGWLSEETVDSKNRFTAYSQYHCCLLLDGGVPPGIQKVHAAGCG